jgi:hypothetical protein
MAKKQETTEQTAATEGQEQITQAIEPIVFEYIGLMEENGIDKNQLPEDIKKKIRATFPTLAKYNKSGNKSYRDTLIKQDYVIVNLIGDWIEQDLPTEEEYNKSQQPDSVADEVKTEGDSKKEEGGKVETEKKDDSKVDSKTDDKANAKSDDKESTATKPEEKEEAPKEDDSKKQIDIQAATHESVILDKINSHPDKIITTADLQAILGRKIDNQDRVTVNNTYLKKILFKKQYQLIKSR